VRSHYDPNKSLNLTQKVIEKKQEEV